jgi:predicted Ser/Thr protein kinase
METESEIVVQDFAKVEAEQGFHSFKLLRTTANARLYVAHKQGKRFLIKTTKDNTDLQLRLLWREYELSISTTHPHIVHTYTYEQNLEVGAGIVMEYVDGRTLAEYLAEAPSKSERNRVFRELLLAVGYLHKMGVLHNDLKPENILISRADNSLKLIDFSLADDSMHYALKSLGCTPIYASPELRERRDRIDARSDIYSIGVIMEQIFGRSSISKRCMAANPERRYENVEALDRAWRRRDLPYYVVGVIALLAVIVTPLLNVVYQTSAARQHDRIKRQILERFDRELTAVCSTAMVNVQNSVYVEFATMNIELMRQRCSRLLDSVAESCGDEDIEVQLNIRYRNIFLKAWEDAIELNLKQALPSYHLETSQKCWPFYDSLIDNRLQFVNPQNLP